ncbi:MAG: Hydroxyethylthiazole kinase [Roseomonas sp.]|nr:Hydroxyethylthiazole kinase [Roseomonas sp.]
MPGFDGSDVIARLRAAAPLVHNITNYVVANLTANALLAVGASPAMVEAEEEVAEFVRRAAALVVNIGTLTAPRRVAMHRAAAAAAEAGVPWILDPVAAGATGFRLETAQVLAAQRPAVVRGNASEILALAGQTAGSRGVDSVHAAEAARDAARGLARRLGTVVAVTGAVDYVTDGARMMAVANGHALLTRVTGTGCTATALIGAFLGAGLPPMEAALAGLVLLGVAAEHAAAEAAGPASFQVALLDRLALTDDAALAAGARVTPA